MPIKMTVRETEAPKPIPEGIYRATVIDITEGTGEFGDYLKFTFEIIDEGAQKGVARTAVVSKNCLDQRMVRLLNSLIMLKL